MNYYMLANRLVKVEKVRITYLMNALNGQPDVPLTNPVAGAPVSFVRTLMSGNSSHIIRSASS